MKRMFKGGIVVFIGLIVIVLAGCGVKTDKLQNVKENINAKIENGQKAVEEKKGIMGGLKEAMKKGVTMKCVADSADGHWVTYTNGKNSRTDGTTADGHEMAILVTDGIAYTWDKKTKKGQKIDKKCMEDFQKDMGLNTPTAPEKDNFEEFTPEKMEIQEEDGRLKCSPSTKADFSVPSDVEFTDQCALMKKQMSGLKDQMEKIKNMQK